MLNACADDRLLGFVLRLVLTEHVEVPRAEQTDWLTKAEAVFAPVKTKVEKTTKRPKATAAKAKSPKATGKNKAA